MNSSDYIFKTVIVGNTGVGKSCLIQKYTRDQFIAYHETTIGVDFAIKKLKIHYLVNFIMLNFNYGIQRVKKI